MLCLQVKWHIFSLIKPQNHFPIPSGILTCSEVLSYWPLSHTALDICRADVIAEICTGSPASASELCNRFSVVEINKFGLILVVSELCHIFPHTVITDFTVSKKKVQSFADV